MTIKKRLSFGIAILLVLFLALGIVSYFHIGKIDDNLSRIMQGRELGKRSALLYQHYKALDEETINKKSNQDSLFLLVVKNLENVNNIIDEKIQIVIDSKISQENKKASEITNLWITLKGKL